MAEFLQLAPPEARLLKQVVTPEPPGRLRSFFERPVQRPRDVMLAVLLAGVGLVFSFFTIGLTMELLGGVCLTNFSRCSLLQQLS